MLIERVKIKLKRVLQSIIKKNSKQVKFPFLALLVKDPVMKHKTMNFKEPTAHLWDSEAAFQVNSR